MMTDKSRLSSDDSLGNEKSLPFSGELPQVVFFIGAHGQVVRADRSLAGDTFTGLPDITRCSPHELLHKGRPCGEDCELGEVLRDCERRLLAESIVDVEVFDSEIDRLLRLRYLRSVGDKRAPAFTILHVVDITAGREVTHALFDTNQRLGALYEEKASALESSEEQNQQHSEKLREMDRHLRTLSTRLILAQEQERNRIASDLHDGVGQHLSLSKYCLEQAIENEQSTESDSRIHESLAQVQRHIESSIQEVRRISRNLKPSMLEEFGLAATLELLAHEFASAHSMIKVTTSIESSYSGVSSEISVAVVRILQEATNNISKHADAASVEFDVSINANGISMKIADDGVGFASGARKAIEPGRPRYGLNNMKERARSSGGDLEILSEESGGTTILVRWPIAG